MTARSLPDLSTAGGPQPSRRRRVAAAVLALLFLNGILSFKEWWPTPGVLPDHRLAPEFVWLWLGLLAAVGLRGALSRRALAAFTLVCMLLVLGRYADVTVPSLFGRAINLYWDGAQIPRFLWVSAQDLAWWQSAGVVAAMLLFLWGLYRLLRLAIAVAAREAVPYALQRRWVWGFTAAAVVLVTANYAGVQATWPVVSKPVIPTYWRQAKLLATAFSPQHLEQVLPPSTTLETALAAPQGAALGALAGRDLYLMPLESYGAVAYDNPEAARRLAPARAQLAADIAEGGRQVVSAFVRSSTFAGGSDLAHLSLLSGLDLSDPLRHDLLLTTERPTLMTLFREQGYQTIGLYPALSWDWPERAFYGFDVFLEGRSLDYRGPPLGYWNIPDQFSLARFEQMHPRRDDAPPRFLFFPTITCHLPFSQVPPYQPDWQRVLTPQPFDEVELGRALAEEPDWLNMFPDYLRMMEYSYRWLGGFLRQPEPRETVFVLVGDHQPAANVSGEGASWDVPVHIVARDADLLARFISIGFYPGLDPPRSPLGGLHDLTAMLLEAFSREGPETLTGGPAQARPIASAGAVPPGDTP
jgi:hypothetical protein